MPTHTLLDTGLKRSPRKVMLHGCRDLETTSIMPGLVRDSFVSILDNMCLYVSSYRSPFLLSTSRGISPLLTSSRFLLVHGTYLRYSFTPILGRERTPHASVLYHCEERVIAPDDNPVAVPRPSCSRCTREGDRNRHAVWP